MLSFNALGVLPKSVKKKTTRGYEYKVTVQYDDCGNFQSKLVEFCDEKIPVSELMELLGSEFMMTSLGNIFVGYVDDDKPKLAVYTK